MKIISSPLKDQCPNVMSITEIWRVKPHTKDMGIKVSLESYKPYLSLKRQANAFPYTSKAQNSQFGVSDAALCGRCG
ncbi:MAG: hypothetical protein Fur0025_40800 [Oscillatoriaceae cyanobacterium]